MKKMFASLVLAVLFFASLAPMVWAQTPSGVITGQVVNGTAGGALPGPMQVTVQGFKGTEPLPAKQAQTDASGLFRADGLEIGEDYTYVLSAEYLGIQYSSDFITFEVGKTEAQAVLFIYETTTSDEAISLARVHFVVEVTEGTLDVTEVQSFSNSGDRTYIGAEPAASAARTTVRIVPPQGAENIQLDEGSVGGRFVQVEGGVADTLPVVPGNGTLQVVLYYQLPYDPASTTLSTTLLYPAAAANVFIPDNGMEFSSERLAFMSKMGTGPQAYVGYVGVDFAKGETLSMVFKGSPTGGSASATPAAGKFPTLGYVLVIGGLALLLVAGAVAYPSLRRRRQAEPAPAAPPVSEDEQDELMAAVADLDDLSEAGELDEETYRKRRQALKARLLEIEGQRR